jgi:hypothetical protein
MLQTVAEERGFGPYQPPFPFIVEVARRLGGNWGLNGIRGNPKRPAADVLAYRIPGEYPQLYDVLYSSGVRNVLMWHAHNRGPSVWLDPNTFEAPDAGTPLPTPPPGEPPEDDTPNPGRGHPRVPSNMHPLAMAVGKVIQERMQSLPEIPTGREDKTLPPEQTQAVRDAVTAITVVTAHWAITLAGMYNQQGRQEHRGVDEQEERWLENMLDSIFPRN